MRQWCLPAIAPSSDALLTGVPSPRLPGALLDARMECCDVEPRYTIEQIDLLQRLRLSGMSKPQIVHALESLERLDPIPGPAPAPAPAQSSSSLSSSSSLTSATTQTPSLDASPSPSNSYEASPPPLYPTSGGQRSFCYDLVEEDWDLEERVEEYMRRDSNMVKEEIKVFLNSRRISQAIVGQVTGISQSYISQWLLQQGLEMSDSKRRAFYRWYLLERSSPGATLSFRPLVKEEPDWRTSISPGGGGAVLPGGGAGVAPVGGAMRLRRGSRFTWRKECLSIMEGFFVENQYPDEAKREEIANACNSVTQKPGCRQSEFERVTALKVYNWFANRRKDMKRRANIEAAILESLSPSCHSNGEEAEPPELTEQMGGDLRQTTLYQEEVSTRKDCEKDASLLVTGAISLPSPSQHLANQKPDELKTETADEE
ncbi:homeobox-containing protein 1-like isoform X2 [Conger conger]|uniref:homeobox-containing protein 1-like isoform X2 n=1 Tax=Conger conger TaxID=82655 RepID=UPI002A5B0028|nr:homeobox-containing protein 1-like isoform X2 [Conger conger]